MDRGKVVSGNEKEGKVGFVEWRRVGWFVYNGIGTRRVVKSVWPAPSFYFNRIIFIYYKFLNKIKTRIKLIYEIINKTSG